MAYEISDARVVSFPLAADLSNNQFCFVKLDSTGQAVACGKGSYAIGILTNQPSAGVTAGYNAQVQASVAVDGITRLAVTGAYSVGQTLVPNTTSDGTGWGSSVSDSTSNYAFVRAIAMQASTAAGDVIAVKLVGPQYGTDSTVLK